MDTILGPWQYRATKLTVGTRLSLCLPHPTCDVGRTLPELRSCDMKEARTTANRSL